jgi:DNA repair exonuclease SbcCD ATPase subunit
LLCFDEVLDASLDSSGKEQLMDILKNLHNDTNIYVITHSEDFFEQGFERVLEVSKRGNFSQMRVA